MPKTSISIPDELAEPLRRWRQQHPGAALADLIRIGLTPPPQNRPAAADEVHHRAAVDDHERRITELARLVDELDAWRKGEPAPGTVDDLRRTVRRLTARVDEHERHHAEHEAPGPRPLASIGEYQQRLEDSAEARALAYHGTLTAAIGDGPRDITTAEAATIWACVTQSARDRLRMLAALNLATVDDTGRPHVWTITR